MNKPIDNFTVIYKILRALESAMDYPEFDVEQISPERFQISRERWSRYIEMMADMELVKGVQLCRYTHGETAVDCKDMRITLKGLEYLTENSIMKKLYDAAKGIKDITPFV